MSRFLMPLTKKPEQSRFLPTAEEEKPPVQPIAPEPTLEEKIESIKSQPDYTEDFAKMEEQYLGRDPMVQARADFDRVMAAKNLQNLAQKAFSANQEADLLDPKKIAGDSARQALRGIIPAISPVSPTVIPKSKRERAADQAFAPYAADTAIVAFLAAHGNVPALLSYGAIRATGTALDKLPKLSETKVGKKAIDMTEEVPLAGIGIGNLQAKIPTKTAMDLIQTGAKIYTAIKAGRLVSGAYLNWLSKSGMAPIKAIDKLAEHLGKNMDSLIRDQKLMTELGIKRSQFATKEQLRKLAERIWVESHQKFGGLHESVLSKFGITPKQFASEVAAEMYKWSGQQAMSSIMKTLKSTRGSALIPNKGDLGKLKNILDMFKVPPELAAQAMQGSFAALPAQVMSEIQKQLPNLFKQEAPRPSLPSDDFTASPPFPEKGMPEEPSAISPSIEEGEMSKAKPLSGYVSDIFEAVGTEAPPSKGITYNEQSLSQDPEDSFLEKVPKEYKQDIKDLFKLTEPDEVRYFIKQHPQYIAAENDLKKKPIQKVYDQYELGEKLPDNYEKYIEKFMSGKTPAPEGQRPEVIIMVGVPASQKSMLLKQWGKNKTHVLIDNDEAKEFIDEFAKNKHLAQWVHEESDEIASHLLDRAIDQRMNIALPKIGKTEKTMADIIEKFKEKGYSVRLVHNNLPSTESMKRAFKRLLEDGRHVNVDYIEENALKIRPVYDKVKLLADAFSSHDVNVPFGKKIIDVEQGGRDGKESQRGLEESGSRRGSVGKDPESSIEGLQQEKGTTPQKVSPKKGTHRTLSGYIKARGGITSKSLKANGINLKEFRQYGLGHLINNSTGQPLDQIAMDMQSAGDLFVPDTMNPSDYLYEQLKSKAPYQPSGEPTKKMLEEEARYYVEQERIAAEQKAIDKELGIDFDVDEIEAEIQQEMIKRIDAAQKAAGKPSVLNMRDVKKVIRQNAGILKVSDLVKESDALEGRIKAEAMAAKVAYQAGKIEEAAKRRQKELMARIKKNLIERYKSLIKEIHKVDASEFSDPHKGEIEAIQSMVDPAVPSARTVFSLRNTLDYMETNPDVELPDYVIDQLKRLEMMNRQNMSMEQLESLAKTVKHHEHLQKNKDRMLRGRLAGEDIKDRPKYSDVKKKAIGELKPAKDVRKQIIEAPDEKKARLKRAADSIVHVFGINQESYDLIVETLAGEDSENFKLLFQDVHDGMNKQRAFIQKMSDKVKEEAAARGLDKIKDLSEWRKEKVNVRGYNLSRGERVSLALHTKNEHNLTHLLEGGFVFGSEPNKPPYKIKEEDLDAILESLDKNEQAFVELNPIIGDEIYSAMDRIFYAKNGYHMPKEEFYFRIKVARGELSQEQQEASAIEYLKDKHLRIGVKKGFLNKRRTGAKQGLVLNDYIYELYDHIQNAATYIGLEIPLSNASKLVYDKEWRSIINNRYGEEVWKQIEKGLRDFAGSHEDYSAFEKALRDIKNLTYKSVYSINVPVWVKQTLSFPLYHVYIDKDFLLQGIQDYTRDPKGIIERHKEMSPEFRHRLDFGFERDAADLFEANAAEKMFGKKSFSDTLMKGMKFFDKQTVAAGMQGAVLQELDRLKDVQMDPAEKLRRAYAFADYVTNRTQPTWNLEHRSPLSRGKMIEQMLTFATAATNKQLNLVRRTWRDYRRTKEAYKKNSSSQNRAKRDEAFNRMVKTLIHIGITIPVAIGFIDWLAEISYRRTYMPRMTAGYMGKKMLRSYAGNVILLRDMYDVAEKTLDNGGYGVSLSSHPAVGLVEDMIKGGSLMLKGISEKDGKAFSRGVDHILNVAMASRGLPYRTPKRMVQAAVQTIKGERKWEGQKKSSGGGSRFIQGGGSGGGSGQSRFIR